MEIQGNTATIIDKRTGQPVQQFQFTPEQVFNAAMGLNNRSLYWQVLAQRVSQTQKGGTRQQTPDQEELTRARIENVKARTDRLKRTPIKGGAGGGGTSDAAKALIDRINAEEGGTPASPKGEGGALTASQAVTTPVSDPADAEMTQDDGDSGTNAGGKPTQADTVAPDSVLRVKPPQPGSAGEPAPPVTPAGNDDGYQQWLQKNGLREDPDYDMRGAFAAGEQPDQRGHMTDKYKKPTHPTFSDESVYNDDDKNRGGHWSQAGDGKWSFAPGPANLKNGGIKRVRDYLAENDPDVTLLAPAGKQPVSSGEPDYSAPDRVPDNVQIAHDGTKYVSPKATIAPDQFSEEPPKPSPYQKYMADAAKLPTKERTAVTTLLRSKQAAYDKSVADYNNRKKAFDQQEARRVQTETKQAQTDLAKSMTGYDQTFKGQELNRATTEVKDAWDAATKAAPYGGQSFDDPATPEAKKALADNADAYKTSIFNDKQVPQEKLRSMAFSLMTSNPNMTAERAVRLVQQLTTVDPADATKRVYKPVGRDVTSSKNVVLQPAEGAPYKFGPVHMRQEAYDDLATIVQGRLKRAAATAKDNAGPVTQGAEVPFLGRAGVHIQTAAPGQKIEPGATAGPTSQDVVDKASRIVDNAKAGVKRALTVPERKGRTLIDDIREGVPKAAAAVRGAVAAIPGGKGEVIQNMKPSYPAYDYSKQGAVPLSGPR